MIARAPIFPSNRLQALAVELFERLGYPEVETDLHFEGALWHDYEINILFGLKGDVGIAEIKYYRFSSPPSRDAFVQALRQASTIQHETGADRTLLVISCPIEGDLLAAAEEHPNIEIWDATELFRRARPFPDLVAKFEDLFEVSAPSWTDVAAQESAIGSEGKRLAKKLRSVPPGKGSSTDFEDACIDAVRHLFAGDSHGWHVQDTTEDGLHRRDLICRVLPKAEVWKFMLADLGSRYVVFEFKNYSAAITQNEIVSTEKYLYPAALRKIAIVLSPLGSSESADKVIQGAMREHGKLILSLSVGEVCGLLEAKDNLADPNLYLFERVDRFMMSLTR